MSDSAEGLNWYIELPYTMYRMSLLFFSNFVSNNGGLGGAMSTAYVPLNFSGINVFRANKGRAFLVSDIDTNLSV